MTAKVRSLYEAKERFGSMPGIAGVGEGEKGEIVIMLEKEDVELTKLVHRELSVVPHRIQVVGQITARRG